MKLEKKVVDVKKLEKPEPVAVNAKSGGYAAGCPSQNSYECNNCYRM